MFVLPETCFYYHSPVFTPRYVSYMVSFVVHTHWLCTPQTKMTPIRGFLSSRLSFHSLPNSFPFRIFLARSTHSVLRLTFSSPLYGQWLLIFFDNSLYDCKKRRLNRTSATPLACAGRRVGLILKWHLINERAICTNKRGKGEKSDTRWNQIYRNRHNNRWLYRDIWIFTLKVH